ncbi:MAG TPA: helix-turn-helix transcriptional regulator, partial [Candidatus Binatia bacterium]|nr:helix-turn-helix transcriptional regulator [Candidatus Binatia bacterium]
MSSTSSLGSHLRALRQRRGVSLEEMARLTRVVSRYLEALEADDLTALPAPVFVRGFIRAYCQALGESAETALSLYREQAGLPPPPVTRPPVAAGSPGHDSARRSTVLVSFVLLVVLGIALFGVTLALQSGRERVARRPASVAQPTTEGSRSTAESPASPVTTVAAPGTAV